MHGVTVAPAGRPPRLSWRGKLAWHGHDVIILCNRTSISKQQFKCVAWYQMFLFSDELNRLLSSGLLALSISQAFNLGCRLLSPSDRFRSQDSVETSLVPAWLVGGRTEARGSDLALEQVVSKEGGACALSCEIAPELQVELCAWWAGRIASVLPPLSLPTRLSRWLNATLGRLTKIPRLYFLLFVPGEPVKVCRGEDNAVGLLL